VRARRARGKFSNDWKTFFQWLEKNGRIFPMIGKIFRAFSNDWKKFSGQGKRKRKTQRTQRERACGASDK
jgi:hypothetical protein